MADDFDQIQRYLEEVDAELVSGLWKAVTSATQLGVQRARTNHHWQTKSGESAAGITSALSPGARGATGVIVASGDNLMRLVTGTQPHTIQPKVSSGFVGPTRRSQGRRDANDIGTTRVALRWTNSGGVHFARKVEHPGTKADPWMDEAADAANELLELGVKDAVTRALRGG